MEAPEEVLPYDFNVDEDGLYIGDDEDDFDLADDDDFEDEDLLEDE